MKLAYSDDEICDLYKYAVDKHKQLRVLADLNNCHVEDIKKVLVKRGYELPEKKKLKCRGRKYSFSLQLAMELYNKGLNDVKIAEVLNCTRSNIAHWRKVNGLLPHYNR